MRAVKLENVGKKFIIKYLNENGVDTRICWPSIFKQDYHSQIFSLRPG